MKASKQSIEDYATAMMQRAFDQFHALLVGYQRECDANGEPGPSIYEILHVQ